MDDLGEQWEKDVAPAFELSRFLVSSHTLQRVKARHHGTRRWQYVGPLYGELFNTLYEDIMPDTRGVIFDLDNEACASMIVRSKKPARSYTKRQ